MGLVRGLTCVLEMGPKRSAEPVHILLTKQPERSKRQVLVVNHVPVVQMNFLIKAIFGYSKMDILFFCFFQNLGENLRRKILRARRSERNFDIWAH